MTDDGRILISGCRIVSMCDELPREFIGDIAIDKGRISFVEPAGGARTEQFRTKCSPTVIDGRDRIAIPGLVNAHNHAAMSLMRGYADDMALDTWLNEWVWPFERHLTPDDIAAGVGLSAAEMLLGGTTTFVDMYNMQSAAIETVTRSGIRAVLGIGVTDGIVHLFHKDADEIGRVCRLPGSGRVRFIAAPHAPYTATPETLAAVKEVCDRYGMGLSIHMAETRKEIETIRRRYGMTPVEYLDSLGLLDAKTIAVHCIWLTDRDMEIMAARGTNAVHCPESNMKLASGIAPVTRMRRAGINVAIGTDGPCSNNDLDMFGEMRSASLLQKVSTGDPEAIPAYEALRMATVNGARAIGMQGELGVIAPGALADIVLIDCSGAHFHPMHDVISNIVYSAKSSDVDTVIVDGRIVVSGGRLLTLDTKTLRRDVQRSVERIKSRM